VQRLLRSCEFGERCYRCITVCGVGLWEGVFELPAEFWVVREEPSVERWENDGYKWGRIDG